MIPDVLGDGYEQKTLPLPDDFEGAVVATLVRKKAVGDRPSRRAVLYVHGYVDYFFQTELADTFACQGYNFYAIDLRKYGRSLRPHQTVNFCLDVAEYFPDLDAAVNVILNEDGNTELLIVAHSTGGLIAPLYVHHRRNVLPIRGLILNSPFFDVNVKPLTKRLFAPFVKLIGRVAPHAKLPAPFAPYYAQSIHSEEKGEWRYNLEWKPMKGIPLYAGWLRAILNGQRELQRGLAIPCPILILSSRESSWPREWSDTVARTDVVLDVRHMSQFAFGLGNHVTLVRIERGIHDLVLSAKPVRERVYREMGRWVKAYC